MIDGLISMTISSCFSSSSSSFESVVELLESFDSGTPSS